MAHKRFIMNNMGIDDAIADIAELDGMLALMWPWFIAAFDDWGRMDVSKPRQVKLDLFPMIASITAKTIEEAISAYSDKGLVYRFEVADKIYIAIEPCKFYKYQTYIREEKRAKDHLSKIPAPEHAPWENCADCRDISRKCAKVRAECEEIHPSPSPSPSPSLKPEEEEKARVCEEADIEKSEPVQQTTDEKRQKDEAEIFKFFNSNVGMITPFQTQTISGYLDDGLDPGMIIAVLQDSIGMDNMWAWIKKVLDENFKINIRTKAQYEAHKLERANARSRDKPPNKSGSKPPQAGNFEQRKYSDDFFESLYKK